METAVQGAVTTPSDFPFCSFGGVMTQKESERAARLVYLSNKSSFCATTHKCFHACLDKCSNRFSPH